MSAMTDYKELIIQEESEFQRLFADVSEKEWGLLFYNQKNPESNDSNHAVLYPDKIPDLGRVLDEIKAFYLARELEPLIYHPLLPKYFTENKTLIEQYGWKVTLYDDSQIMVLAEPSAINIPHRLDICRLREWDARLEDDVFIAWDELWEMEVVKSMISYDDCHFFVGYLNDEPVVFVYLHVSPLGCTRFDHIITAPKHRGKGFGREIMHHVTNYCIKNRFPLCYQWPISKTSYRMCYESGFRNAFTFPAGAAVYKVKKSGITR